VALAYVECYPDGYKEPTSIAKVCMDVDMQGFPTWIIQVQKVEGDWALTYLDEVADAGGPKALAKRY
jgi:hypothetical protein